MCTCLRVSLRGGGEGESRETALRVGCFPGRDGAQHPSPHLRNKQACALNNGDPHLLGLANAVGTVLGLKVHHGVPVRVEDNDLPEQHRGARGPHTRVSGRQGGRRGRGRRVRRGRRGRRGRRRGGGGGRGGGRREEGGGRGGGGVGAATPARRDARTGAATPNSCACGAVWLTVSAVVRLMPMPPARVDSRKIK